MSDTVKRPISILALGCVAFFVIQRTKSTSHSSEFARLEIERFTMSAESFKT